ncbi:MAG: 16S rRNA (cytosine967-C5)-methyltransferase [Myxococcota bacterium]
MDPRLLAKAARPGRVRGIGLELYRAAAAEPRRAGAVLHDGLRRARALHSRERRFVADALHDLIRHERLLDRATGLDTPESRWHAWLVHLGLPVDEAAATWEGAMVGWDRATHLRRGATEEEISGLHPAVFAEVQRAFGDLTGQFIDASNERADTVLRANRKRTDRARLLARLAKDGVPCHAGRWTPDAVVVEGRANLHGLRAFREGWFEIQDGGSQALAALVPDGGPGLDLCAGAGGKTLAVAARGAGPVLATDVRARALTELRRRAERARTPTQTRHIGDGPLPDDIPMMAWVLVDAPCSGTGVLRRHPEHRWQLDDARLAELTALQRRLLARGATRVRPGGTLVYGTCSVLPCENEDVVEAFLRDHPEFSPAPASARVPWAGGVLRTAPHTHGCDGLFGAVLTRRRG